MGLVGGLQYGWLYKCVSLHVAAIEEYPFAHAKHKLTLNNLQQLLAYDLDGSSINVLST